MNLKRYAFPVKDGNNIMHNPIVKTGNESVAYSAESIADCSDG